MSSELGSGTMAATPQQNRLSAEISVLQRTATVPLGDRYVLGDLLASGGMGAVYLGFDRTLERRVAVKLMHQDCSDVVGLYRFQEEAKITAQLQHPSIPPIYDLGFTEEGKPFLAMKLIEGRTLDAILKTDRDTAPLIRVFLAIAQALGFAHTRGVIHRDLKPTNIMVGAFGEVQVMDWGLAKVLAKQDRACGRSNESVEIANAQFPSVSEATQVGMQHLVERHSKTTTGSAMGTPAYMPPEQARGQADQISERSDVFGLGGILCAILTGQPPFVGHDATELQHLSALGTLSETYARLDASGSDPELIVLAKRCLAAEPSQRPANGLAVAELVEQYLSAADERIKQAELRRARSEARRRLLLLSSLAVVFVLTLGAGISLMQARRAQRAEADANAKRTEVEESLTLVADRTKLALESYNQLVTGIQVKLMQVPNTQDLRKELLETARKGLAQIIDAARKHGSPDTTLIWVHIRQGDIEQQLGNSAAAQAEFRSAFELAKQLNDADPSRETNSFELSMIAGRLGDTAHNQGQIDEAAQYFDVKHTIDRERIARNPNDTQAGCDLCMTFLRLASLQVLRGRMEEALEYYRASEDYTDKVLAGNPTNQLARELKCATLDPMSDALFNLGRIDEVLQKRNQCRELLQRMMADYPNVLKCRRDFGVVCLKIGHIHEIRSENAAAAEQYRAAHAIFRELAAADPRNWQAQVDLSCSCDKLGVIARREKQFVQARAHMEEAHQLILAVSRQQPTNIMMKQNLSITCDSLGYLLNEMGQLQDAYDWFAKAYFIREQLLAANPTHMQLRIARLVAYCSLGYTTIKMNAFGESLYWWTNADTTIKEFVEKGWIRPQDPLLGSMTVKEYQEYITTNLHGVQIKLRERPLELAPLPRKVSP